ncbi:MAG: M23 family metallopeptidase [Anaerolineaceae bacterium]|nr:M23 family metallopeptidase [Anaerolineaceae bacterium]
MFNDLPSRDGITDESEPPIHTEENLRSRMEKESGWDRFWNRVNKLGMGDVIMRAGTALVTIGLVGLVVWVMKSNFISEDMASRGAESANSTAGGPNSGEVALPVYEGVAPVEGITKSAETHTDASSESRYDFQQYEVVAGDTLFGIAEKYGIKAQSILWTNFNALYENPAGIVPGQILTIPPVDGAFYTWHEGDGLNGVAKGLNVTPEAIIEWPGNNLSYETIGDFSHPNIEPDRVIFVPGGIKTFQDWTSYILPRDEPAESAIWGEGKCGPATSGPIGTGVFIWPADDPTISGFDYLPEINHYGIDVAGDLNDPLYAVDSGVVVYAGWNDWGYGNVIAIDHGNNFQSIYAHLESLNVGCHAFVTQGDIIGYMGSTGNSTGPHLHYELILNGGRVNPHHYLPH